MLSLQRRCTTSHSNSKCNRKETTVFLARRNQALSSALLLLEPQSLATSSRVEQGDVPSKQLVQFL